MRVLVTGHDGYIGTAMVHLAALSNDPLGNLDPALADEINHLAPARLARARTHKQLLATCTWLFQQSRRRRATGRRR